MISIKKSFSFTSFTFEPFQEQLGWINCHRDICSCPIWIKLIKLNKKRRTKKRAATRERETAEKNNFACCLKRNVDIIARAHQASRPKLSSGTLSNTRFKSHYELSDFVEGKFYTHSRSCFFAFCLMAANLSPREWSDSFEE